MLKDITLGQYFPGNSPVHRLDPRTKLVILVLYIIALFVASSWLSYLAVFVFFGSYCHDIADPPEIYCKWFETVSGDFDLYRCFECVFYHR